MRKVLLGNSGYALPQMGLGLAALGRPGYINLGHASDLNHEYDVEIMRENTYQALDKAYSCGVRYFDTAQSYGRGELYLADWIKERNLSDDQLVTGSKWGYTYTAGWKVTADHHEVKDHSYATLKRQFPISFRRLGEHLKLYQIHSATFESGVLSNFDVLNHLGELKQENNILIGLSLSGPNQAEVLRKAMSISHSEEPLFDCVQFTFNLMEQSMGGIAQEAYDKGIGIIVKEAVANGRLTVKNKQNILPMAQMANDLGVTIDALSLAYVASRSWSPIVLSGAANTDQLVSNLEYNHIDLSEMEYKKLERLSMSASAYWKARSALEWN